MFLLFVCIVSLIFMMVGFYRGFIGSVLHLSSTLFGIWVAKQYYQPFSDYLRLFLPFPKTLAYDAHYVFTLHQPELRFDRVCGFIFILLIVKTMMYMVISSFGVLLTGKRPNIVSRGIGVGISIIAAIILLHFVTYIAVLIPDTQLQTHVAETQMGYWFVMKVPFLSQMTLHL